METDSCSYYEHNTSRKRALDGGIQSKPKRHNVSSSLPLIKLLIPNYAAGALIGKGGTLLSEMQSKFGVTLRLSANKEFYPGTDERIVVVTGQIDPLIEFNNHLMEKVQSDRSKQPTDEHRSQQVRIVLTNEAAGFLIGTSGVTIKAIQEESKARISIENRNDGKVIGERLLTMSGSIDQRKEGCKKIIEKIAVETTNQANNKLNYTDERKNIQIGNSCSVLRSSQLSTQFHAIYTDTSSPLRKIRANILPNLGTKIKLKSTVKIELEIPNILVGSILGKHGMIIHELMQFSGAKIQFSPKNEFVHGTTNRILTIAGNMRQTQTAYFLVIQQVEHAESELNTFSHAKIFQDENHYSH